MEGFEIHARTLEYVAGNVKEMPSAGLIHRQDLPQVAYKYMREYSKDTYSIDVCGQRVGLSNQKCFGLFSLGEILFVSGAEGRPVGLAPTSTHYKGMALLLSYGRPSASDREQQIRIKPLKRQGLVDSLNLSARRNPLVGDCGISSTSAHLFSGFGKFLSESLPPRSLHNEAYSYVNLSRQTSMAILVSFFCYVGIRIARTFLVEK